MESSSRIDGRLAALVFFVVLLLSIPQAALLPLLDRDEPRFAEASREMVQTGDLVVPTFNGAPRYAKPVLIYWCQAACYRVFGENAFAARLPSLVATAGTACVLLVWAIRLGSAKVGFGAAVVYAFCLQTMQQGRVATADALLIFFMTVTAFAGWRMLNPREPGKPHPACFAVLALGFGFGFLAKGPEAWLPLLPLLWCARRSGVVMYGRIIGAFILSVGLVLLWAWPAYQQTHGDYWRQGLSEGVGERMVSGLQGHGGGGIFWYLLGVIFYYPIFFLAFALPWWPLAAWALWKRRTLVGGWKPDETDVYLLLNAAVIVVIFTFMVTKLPHYTLPAYPFLALFLARRWSAAGLSLDTLTRVGWRTGIVFALVALVGIPLAIAFGFSPSPAGRLVHDARPVLTPETKFAVVDFQEPNTIWEMRRAVKTYGLVIPGKDALAFLSEPGPHAILLTTELWKQIDPDAYDKVTDSKHVPWTVLSDAGFNAAKGKRIDLTLVVKP